MCSLRVLCAFEIGQNRKPPYISNTALYSWHCTKANLSQGLVSASTTKYPTSRYSCVKCCSFGRRLSPLEDELSECDSAHRVNRRRQSSNESATHPRNRATAQSSLSGPDSRISPAYYTNDAYEGKGGGNRRWCRTRVGVTGNHDGASRQVSPP